MTRQLRTLLMFTMLIVFSGGTMSFCFSDKNGPDSQLSCLVRNGKSSCVIVIRSNATDAEKTAANELQHHIELISGAQLKIISETDYKSGMMIAVGFNSRLPKELSLEHFGHLAEEEILIQPFNDKLLLAGGSPRGTLYAVYEYLNQLGVRFYSPTFTKIPALKTLYMPKPYRYSPPARARSLTVGNAGGPEWYARNMLNSISLWSSPGEKYGGGLAEGPDMHTFWCQMPVEMLRKNPDWAAEVNGKRMLPAGNNNWGLCLNPEVRAYLVKKGVSYAHEHPELQTIWVGINDGSPYCTCDYCKSFYASHGGAPSSLVLQLVNELADAINVALPGKMVKTLAYEWTKKPPTGIKARDNVIVMFCAQTDYILPIETNPDAATLREYAANWKKVCKNMSVYLYAYPCENYWFPTPCLYTFAKNIKWAYSSGINDIYMQISGFGGSYGSEAMDMRAWAYSRLMWNPSLNFQKLISEFARDNYGSAAEAVISAINLEHRDVVDHNGLVKQLNNSPVVPHYIDQSKIRLINTILDKAHRKLENNEQRKRFELFWIPYLWADVWSGFTTAGKFNNESSTWAIPMEDGNLRNHYAKLAKQYMIENNINGLREMVTMNPAALAIDKMGVNWKAYRLADSQSSVVVVPEVAGNLFDLKSSESSFEPLKNAWMFAIARYPMHSSWHDLINGDYVSQYTVKASSPGSITLENETSDRKMQKSVRITDGTVKFDLECVSLDGSVQKLESHLMLDMLPDAFGDAPEVYVEKQDKTWSKKVLGEGLGSFWYESGEINLSNATGRILIASTKRHGGLLLTIDPLQLEKIGYDYDRYDYPDKYGHMLDLVFKASSKNNSVRLSIGAKIVTDAIQFACN